MNNRPRSPDAGAASTSAGTGNTNATITVAMTTTATPETSAAPPPLTATATTTSVATTTTAAGGVTTTSPPQLLSQLGSPHSERERRARERIAADRYDAEAWNMLASEAQMRPLLEATVLYEILLANFPTAARYWRSYVEAYMMANNDNTTKSIFSRCLLGCLHVDLWRCYIRFIRKSNENRGPEGRDETKKAYGFMLGHIGMDIDSGPVWLEYISFLKAAPATSSQEESQRMTAVRKAYQRAVLVPMHLVEQLWKEYESFENSVSRALAKSLLAEFQPKHFNARAVYRERKKFCERIDTSMLAVPPTGSPKEEQQFLAWRQLLAFEKGNPQKLDPASLTKRVAFTYEQCLMYLYHYPDIWYEYATWHAENGSPESAAVVFQRALKALPDKPMLYYAYAEFEEARGCLQDAKKVYEALLKNNDACNALAFIHFIHFVQRTEGSDGAVKVLVDIRKSPKCTYHVYVASALTMYCREKNKEIAKSIFEMGLKKFIHETAYVLEYADFLCRINDAQNVRVLFERALNVLPVEQSVEVWNRFLLFEQTYGDIPSMLKVQQRRKEALSQVGEDNPAFSESILQQLVTRYRFLDLLPCSSQDLEHLARQQTLAQRIAGKTDKEGASNIGGDGVAGSASTLIRPDPSKMVVYDSSQGSGQMLQQNPLVLGLQLNTTSALSLPGVVVPQQKVDDPSSMSVEEIVKVLPTTLRLFINQLPVVEGPFPNVEMVITEILHVNLPVNFSNGPVELDSLFTAKGSLNSIADASRALPGSNGLAKVGARGNSTANMRAAKPEGLKRKEPDRQEEDDINILNRAPARDVFRLRQLHRVRVANSGQQGGSASGGSGTITGEPSGSSG